MSLAHRIGGFSYFKREMTEVEKECAGELSSLSDSYWLGFQNHLNARKKGNGTPRTSAITEVSHAR